MAMANRHTLSLYRQIFRMARTWQAIDPAETAAERIYIQNEARQLFKANKAVRGVGRTKACARLVHRNSQFASFVFVQVTDADSLRACQCEAEERIELGEPGEGVQRRSK